MFLVGLVDLFERLGLQGVGLVDGFPNVGCLWAEEEHENELDDQEDLEEVEQPEQSEIVVHLAADNRGQAGGGIEHKVDGRDSQASLVDTVEISDNRNDEGLESAGGKALNDTSCQEVFVADFDLANGSADDTEERGDDEDRAFTVATTERAYKGADTADGENVVTRDHDRRCEVFVDLLGDGEIGCIQEGSLL